MKRLLAVFELTVAQQRVIIVLLGLLVLFAAVRSYRHARNYGPAVPPSSSPGIRP